MDNVTAIADQASEAPTAGAFKSNTQAVMEFGHIWAAGWRNISDIMTSASRAHLDHMTATMKAMSDIKTIKGAIDLQMAAIQTSIDQAVTNSSKLSTASMKFADQGMAPIKARMDATMARFSSTRPT